MRDNEGMAAVRCPHCNRQMRRIHRNLLIKLLLPGSRRYECTDCSRRYLRLGSRWFWYRR